MPVDGYIIDYESGDSVKFLYFDPVEESIEAQYDEGVVRGRSEGHVFYSHTNANTFNWAIKLVASVDEADTGDAKQIHSNYLFIKSFQYPDYGLDTKGPLSPPRKVIMTVGNWFRKTGVIQGMSVTHQAPYDEDGYPMVLDVRFVLRVINAVPLGLFDVRAGI